MISAAMWGRLTVQQVNAFQGLKSYNPDSFRDTVLLGEIGMRAYQMFEPCPWEDREDEQDEQDEAELAAVGVAEGGAR